MTRVRTRQRRMRRPPQKYKSKRSNRDKIFKGGASQFYIPRKVVDDVWGSIRGDRYNKFGGPYVKQEKKDSEGNSVGLYVKSGDGINEKICVKSKSDTWWITYSSDMQDRPDGTKRDIGEIFYDRDDATILTFVASEISEKVENIPNIFCTITTPQGTSLEDCISGNLAVTIGKDKYVSTVLLREPEPALEMEPEPEPQSQESAPPRPVIQPPTEEELSQIKVGFNARVDAANITGKKLVLPPDEFIIQCWKNPNGGDGDVDDTISYMINPEVAEAGSAQRFWHDLSGVDPA